MAALPTDSSVQCRTVRSGFSRDEKYVLYLCVPCVKTEIRTHLRSRGDPFVNHTFLQNSAIFNREPINSGNHQQFYIVVEIHQLLIMIQSFIEYFPVFNDVTKSLTSRVPAPSLLLPARHSLLLWRQSSSLKQTVPSQNCETVSIQQPLPSPVLHSRVLHLKSILFKFFSHFIICSCRFYELYSVCLTNKSLNQILLIFIYTISVTYNIAMSPRSF